MVDPKNFDMFHHCHCAMYLFLPRAWSRLLLALGMVCSLKLAAQNNLDSLVIKVHAEDQPVEFATIYFPQLHTGGITDSLGRAVITKIPVGDHEVSVSMTGYFPLHRTIHLAPARAEPLIFELIPRTLDEVVVTGSMRETQRSTSPIPIEIISPQLFRRNPAPNLFEAVNMVSGVQPVINCNVCNTGDIHINGMEGVYTQVLMNGMPIISGLGTVYGLMGIPNSLIERIEVVKGPAGTLYGSEAMAGQINVITKEATQAPQASAEVFTTSWGELNLDAGLKYRPGARITSLLGLNGFFYDGRHDDNGDGFTDLAQQKRLSAFTQWHWQRPNDYKAQVGARYVWEDRWGGQTQWSKAWRGSDQVYGESIYTRRLELFGIYQAPLRRLPLFFQASYSTHHQDSYYGQVKYAARQDIGFVQSYVDLPLNKHRLLTGLALRHTRYDDNTPATADRESTALPGIFIQDDWQLSSRLLSLGGLRLDAHPEHGLVWTPRLALRWQLHKNHQLRLSTGSGFRVVSLFTEDHAALSGAREVVIAEQLKPEKSWGTNLNYNLTINLDRLYLNMDLTGFYTVFSNQILPDYDTDPQKIIYANLDGTAQTRGATVQLNMTNDWPVRLNAGLTRMAVFSTTDDGETIPTLHAPRWSGTFSANYILPRPNLSFDLTGTWYGPQRLPVVPDDFRPEYSPWYTLLNTQLTWTATKQLELYIGLKNLLNFIPAHPILRPFDPFDREVNDPINNPYGYTFDPSYNYASLQGLRGFVGVLYTVK